MKTKVPPEIVTAINAMIAPYGERYSSDGSPGAGYKSSRDARAYLGVSRSFFYRLIKSDILHPIRLTKGVHNGKVVYAVAELDRYIEMCRQV